MNTTMCTRSAMAAFLFVLLQAGFFPASARAESAVKEYFITCNPDSLALIHERYGEDIYISATVRYQDTTWTQVRLRIRGDSSREFPKKSLKLKFDDRSFANGRNELNLNAEYLDKSYSHSILTSRLFAARQYPCFHAEPVRVYINNAFHGLFISIEDIDGDFLESRGLSRQGNLYKASYDGACLSLEDDVNGHWEKKTNEGSGRQDLAQLIDEINTVPDAEYYEFTRRVFDYDKMIDILALNMLTANGSTYYHNYYMYHNPADNKWIMLPWDADKTFGAYGVHYPYARSGNNPFIERALLCEEIFQDIKERLKEITSSHFTAEFLDPVLDSLQAVLGPSVAQDTTDKNPTREEWETFLGHEKGYIRTRYNVLLDQFRKLPRVFKVHNTTARTAGGDYLRWSSSASEKPLTYTVRISKERFAPESESYLYKNITDTSFALPSDLAPGTRYYWTVVATDGTHSMEGFLRSHSFVFSIPTALPSVISDTVRMTAVESPYIIEETQDLIIEKNAVLIAEPGVALHMPEKRNIIVRGGLQWHGTASEPVTVHSTAGARYWGIIVFESGSLPSGLSHVVIGHGMFPDQTNDRYASKITMYDSDVALDNVEFRNCYRGIQSNNGRLTATNCRFPSGNYGELLIVNGGTATVENCVFHNITGGSADAIDLEGAEYVVLRNNRIYGSGDDGIDLGSSTALIEDNTIFNCGDKGVSIGENSDATLVRNTIAHCAYGFSVQGTSRASIDRSTIYDVGYGCRIDTLCTADITNSVLSRCTSGTFTTEPGYILQVQYSLADELLPGMGNISADPKFVNPELGNYRLMADSPCIDAGDPEADADPDGSRADIGSHFFRKIGAIETVVINEIAYNPAEETDTDDWVELYNPNAEPVDLSGWIFRDEDDTHTFTFPANTLLAPHGYIVICTDTAKFRSVFPDVHPVIGNTDFGLAGGGELIRLFNSAGDIVDSLTYDDVAPWPTEPDGNGPTLELISADYDNTLGQSWKASKTNNGTPGAVNSNTTNSVQESGNAALFFLNQNYPNPFGEGTTIECVLLQPAHVAIEVYDALGKPVRTLFSGQLPSGKTPVHFDAADLPSGQYLYVLRVDGTIVKTRSATLLR